MFDFNYECKPAKIIKLLINWHIYLRWHFFLKNFKMLILFAYISPLCKVFRGKIFDNMLSR
jgi:hypothetical protein